MDTHSKRRRFTHDERRAYLDSFEASELSAKRFAEQAGIRYPTFAYWLKSRREPEREQSFVELSIGERRAESGAVEIFLPGGASARAADAATAAALLRELGLAC